MLIEDMLCRFAQQQMTLSDLKWLFYASRAISAVLSFFFIVCMATEITVDGPQ